MEILFELFKLGLQSSEAGLQRYFSDELVASMREVDTDVAEEEEFHAFFDNEILSGGISLK